jgi:hypothetical protein
MPHDIDDDDDYDNDPGSALYTTDFSDVAHKNVRQSPNQRSTPLP